MSEIFFDNKNVRKIGAHPLERSKASWTTTLKASFLRLFLIKNCFSVPPGRYSTTTQHALEGREL